MDPQQQFCLKWNSYSSNLAMTFSNLFKSELLADVTLFCGGKLKSFFLFFYLKICYFNRPMSRHCFFSKNCSVSMHPFLYCNKLQNCYLFTYSMNLYAIIYVHLHLICVQLIKSTPRCER